MSVIDLTGNQFGRLTVMGLSRISGQAIWNCRCECGFTIDVPGNRLRSGKTRSCGCLKRDLAIERGFASRAPDSEQRAKSNMVWHGILERTQNPSAPNYRLYGARGITICERWKSFENFYADMGSPPKGMSIERKDNNGNYSPENCVWATAKQQCRNKRTNRILTLNGISKPMIQWAEDLRLNYKLLSVRVQIGWSDEKVLTTPKRPYSRAGCVESKKCEPTIVRVKE